MKAIWKKAVADAWVQLAASCGLLLFFGWVFVWLMSLFKLGGWATLLNLLPDFVEPMIGVPVADLATPTGRLSLLYVHVITTLTCVGWAVGRGSDSVSGQIARGTMEFLVTLPVRRWRLLLPHAVVSTAGAALLALSVWGGAALGLVTFKLDGQVSNLRFLPGVVNLFSMTVCLTGLATLLSSMDRDRWRTIWLTGAWFILSLIVKIVARVWEPGWWLKYTSFLTPFEPQRLILLRDGPAAQYWDCNWKLLAVALTAYLAAALIFTKRDIPVPR